MLPKDEISQISDTNPLWVLAKVFLFEILNNFYVYWLRCFFLKFWTTLNNVDYLNSELEVKGKKIKKVSQKYGIFPISEHKSFTGIGQHVSLWYFEHFLNIKYGLFILWAVKN